MARKKLTFGDLGVGELFRIPQEEKGTPARRQSVFKKKTESVAKRMGTELPRSFRERHIAPDAEVVRHKEFIIPFDSRGEKAKEASFLHIRERVGKLELMWEHVRELMYEVGSFGECHLKNYCGADGEVKDASADNDYYLDDMQTELECIVEALFEMGSDVSRCLRDVRSYRHQLKYPNQYHREPED